MPTGVSEDNKMKEQRSDSKNESAGVHSESRIRKASSAGASDDGVEVVLNERGSAIITETPERPRPPQDQSIFRHPQAVRPRAVRAPHGHAHHAGHHHYPYVHGSGSWGYHHPADYPPPPPHAGYPVPPHNPSGSFDDQYHHTPHYSPHVRYPPHGYAGEEVNVISPNHKGDPHYRTGSRGARQSGAHGYYQYPPTSPVSRPTQVSSGPPRLRNYAMRRGEGAYSRAQRDGYRDEGSWGSYPPHSHPQPRSSGRPSTDRPMPPVVAESFDSEAHRSPPTPGASPPSQGHPPHDPYQQFYGGGSWGSFDSQGPPPNHPPPQFDDIRYYGHPHPDSPYGPYAPPYSPGAPPMYRSESFPPPPPPPPSSAPYLQTPASFSYSYDEDDRYMQEYHGETSDYHSKHVTPPGSSAKARGKAGTPVASNRTSSGDRDLVLPQAAEEIDFDVTDPPLEPITPPSTDPLCDSMAEVNTYDVLCGRGGGTNSQIGNRRFRKLVQEFQPTYLEAKRKEKPLLARTIVLIIRKRGGRFLKKNEESGELFEVGDTKAEAKTSQALREGLDVRATRSAANNVADKKKKKKCPKSPDSTKMEESPMNTPDPRENTESPPNLPRLPGEEGSGKAGTTHPHSPERQTYRKRRRVRSNDRFFPDFCPPRADLGRTSPSLADCEDDGVLEMAATPIRRNNSNDHGGMHYKTCNENIPAHGCAGIAMDLVTGAATGSFCLGPTGWRR